MMFMDIQPAMMITNSILPFHIMRLKRNRIHLDQLIYLAYYVYNDYSPIEFPSNKTEKVSRQCGQNSSIVVQIYYNNKNNHIISIIIIINAPAVIGARTSLFLHSRLISPKCDYKAKNWWSRFYLIQTFNQASPLHTR